MRRSYSLGEGKRPKEQEVCYNFGTAAQRHEPHDEIPWYGNMGSLYANQHDSCKGQGSNQHLSSQLVRVHSGIYWIAATT